MAEELRFAVRCLGSTQKPRFKKSCSKCKSTRHSQCADVPDSVNGIIQLTEVRKSPMRCSKEFESEFRPEYSQARDFNGDYLHVEYSDVET